MKHSLLTRISVFVFVFSLVLASPLYVLATETEDTVEATAEEIGVSADAANTATEETTNVIKESGMLIEIGNTTAEETTIIIRVIEEGISEDKTIQINANTEIKTNSNRSADLSDWIAGDRIQYTADEGDNSGELVATELKNLSFKYNHHGRNGWVKEIRADKDEMDVEWAGVIYTLNTEKAKMVAGLENPATLDDFQVDDRIRARVVNDGDSDANTWNAQIIVVLRRGETMFMRVTRWVVPAKIVEIPEDTSELPYVITAEVIASPFYQKGDVNNLIGAPGTEFTIEVNDKTKLVRRYLGKAVIGEFMEGDYIRVVGRLNDGTGNLDAVVIKNNSIQALGVSSRISEVTSIDTNANTIDVVPVGVKNPFTGMRFKLTTAATWTLVLDSEAKLYEAGEEISISDIEEGDIVRVRGVANRLQKTVATRALAVVTDKYKNTVEE